MKRFFLVIVFLSGCSLYESFPPFAGSDTGEQSDGTNDTASDSSVDGAGDLEPTSSARLANLETSVGTLDPLFSSDINSYSVVLDVATESLELTATLDDPDALLRLNGMTEVSGVAIPIEVQTGEVRNLVFEVTSADATTKNRYTVQVFRGAPPLYSREIAKLFPKKGETDDAFGWWLHTDGQTIVAIAPGEDSAATGVNGNQDLNNDPTSGAAYVFERDGNIFRERAYIKGPRGFSFTPYIFRDSVIIDGETLFLSGRTTSGGRVLVYRKNNGSWQLDQEIVAPDSSGHFGFSIARVGTLLAVSDPLFEEGRVYVFRESNNGWGLIDSLSGESDGDYFGQALAWVGDSLSVGAILQSTSEGGINPARTGTRSRSGAVYLFSRVGDDWVESAFLKAADPDIDDRFGFSIAVDDETMFVTSAGDDSDSNGIGGDPSNNGLSNSGAVFLYESVSSVPNPVAFIKPSFSSEESSFGRYLAAVSGTMFASASADSSSEGGFRFDLNDDGLVPDSGGVILFDAAPSELGLLKPIEPVSNADCGRAIAPNADILVVGCPGDSGAQTRSGVVYVFKK